MAKEKDEFCIFSFLSQRPLPRFSLLILKYVFISFQTRRRKRSIMRLREAI